MGDELTFNPQLTYGYIAEVGAKLPSNLKLFRLLESQIQEEERCSLHIRDMEDQVITNMLSKRNSLCLVINL